MIEPPALGPRPDASDGSPPVVTPPPLPTAIGAAGEVQSPDSSTQTLRGAPKSVLKRRHKKSRWTTLLELLRPRRSEDRLAASFYAAPYWLISLLVHMLVLLVLALCLLPRLRSNVLSLDARFSDTLGKQLDMETVQLGSETEAEDPPVETPEELPPVEDPLATPPTPPVAEEGPTASTEISVPDVGQALTGREPGSKEALLAAYGGNARTEECVLLGLEWLASNQMRDGSWSLTGPYSNGGQIENPTSATAMALLAFQGAGYTHQSGRFKNNVRRGSTALLRMQDANGCFYRGSVSHHRLYSQAQAMIAVCELYAMTHDSQLRIAADRAVEYAVRIQDSLGGWRYEPGSESDTSVSGWFMMGLQSARMAKLDVPQETIDRLDGYLDRVMTADEGRYAYQPGMSPTYSMTAEAMLCRQYLGWNRLDPRMQRGVHLLLSEPMSWDARDVYAWYYATQVLHNVGGEEWNSWNTQMRELLPANQTDSGAERGSWSPSGDRWGPHAGRLYTTCLSLYMLEVYYRHLPIYQVH